MSDNRLWVGNIKSASKEDLQRAFSSFGDVKEVWMPRDPPGGFAFVEYYDSKSAHSAIRGLDNKTIASDVVKVEMTKKRPNRSGGRGGFGGRGGRGSPPRRRSPPPSYNHRRRSRSRRSRSYRSRSRSPRRSPFSARRNDYSSNNVAPSSLFGAPLRDGRHPDYLNSRTGLPLGVSSLLAPAYSNTYSGGAVAPLARNDFDYSYSYGSASLAPLGARHYPEPVPVYDRNGPASSLYGRPPPAIPNVRYDPYPAAQSTYRPSGAPGGLLDNLRPRSPPPYRGTIDQRTFDGKDDRRNGYDRSRDPYPAPTYPASGPSPYRRSPIGRSSGREFDSNNRSRDYNAPRKYRQEFFQSSRLATTHHSLSGCSPSCFTRCAQISDYRWMNFKLWTPKINTCTDILASSINTSWNKIAS